MAELLRPRLEILEDRLTPTTYGVPFPDPQHLTVSFVPDGTAIGNQSSDLFALMDATEPEAVWQRQILRGLQSWAAATNINLSVVPDNGGSEFGDIRIAAAPLGNNLVATTMPFDPEGGSWSGDMIFNDAFTFGPPSTGGYNVYSVAVHEAGHAFGLPSNLDPSSVMFNYYNGVLTGLAPQDRTAIQAMYGVRAADPWESAPGGNATAATATDFAAAVQQQDIANVTQTGNLADASVSYNSLDADLSRAYPTEYFQYQALGLTGGFTVNLQTSTESLLESQVTVLDQNGDVVGSAVATDPQNGNLSVYVPNAPFGAQYTIEVQSAKHGAFGVGAYQLQVVADDASSPAIVAADAALLALLGTDVTPHRTKADAAVVQPLSPHAALATTTVTLTGANEAQWLKVQAPSVADGGDGSLTVVLWTTSSDTALPAITLENAQGVVQTTTLVTQSNGSIVLYLPDATPKAEYFLKLKAIAGSGDGTFHVTFAFGYPLPDSPQAQTGTMTLMDEQTFNYFSLPTTGVIQLQASATSLNPLAGYEVTVIDSTGDVWYDEFVTNSATLLLNTTLVLPAGNYEVRITVGTLDGSDPGTVPYTFLVKQLNAPLGPPVQDPENPPPLPTSALWLEVPPAFLYITNTDPYGTPFQYPIPGQGNGGGNGNLS